MKTPSIHIRPRPTRDVASGTTTASLDSLTAGRLHTYEAYPKTGCNSADEIASVNITTTTRCSS